MRSNRFVYFLGLITMASIGTHARDVDTAAADEVFATVGDKAIHVDEYNAALQQTIRERFYHGQPPAAMVATVRREVADQMIDRVLLLNEADRLGLKPNRKQVEQQLKQHLDKRSDQGNIDKKALRKWLNQQDVLAQLENSVKNVAQPTNDEIEKYYTNNPDKFTEPEQMRLSVILLAVAPSSSSSVWAAAREEAARIKHSLDNGADFAELARLHSADASGPNGGDMGYLHQGMLSEPVEQVIGQLDIGQTTDPIMVLEGIALFRVVDKRLPKLHALTEVRERVEALARQDQAGQHWQNLINRLRSETDINIEQKYLNET